MTTHLYLIRHGESVPNVTPILGGMRGDTGLTDRGREQAALLEKRLRDEGMRADRLYTSTLPRALETAEYVARALDLDAVPVDDLHELRPGEADGMHVDEWRERYGGLDRGGAVFDVFRPIAPGGESWASFLVRAGGALVDLVQRHPDETVVAVCHGGVLEASFYLALGLGPTGASFGFEPLNTSITYWRHDPERARGGWTLVTFNDAAHLQVERVAPDSPREAVPTPPDEER